MTREQLANGIIVCHVKYGRNYRVKECNMRYKDSSLGWVDGVEYEPLYPNEHNAFVRGIESFLEEFEIVEE